MTNCTKFTCILCGRVKNPRFWSHWEKIPRLKWELLIIDEEKKLILCGACRIKLISELPKEFGNICQLKSTTFTCFHCRKGYTTVAKKNGGVWIITIGDISICERCLRLLPPETPKLQEDIAIKSSQGAETA